MERWNGRVALVTEAHIGIGGNICRELVKYGIRVVGSSEFPEQVQEIAEEDDVKASPGSLLGIKCDLRQEDEIIDMFDEIRKKFGRLDICINSAVCCHYGNLSHGTAAHWREMFEVNVLASSVCARESVNLMKENNINDGQIINISSITGHRIPQPSAGIAFYSGTMAMVKVLTECLRQELRTHKSCIRLSSISPALVETQFFHRLLKDSDNALTQYHSEKCLQMSELVECVIYILQTPPHVDINDILIKPTAQSS